MRIFLLLTFVEKITENRAFNSILYQHFTNCIYEIYRHLVRSKNTLSTKTGKNMILWFHFIRNTIQLGNLENVPFHYGQNFS